MGPKHDAFEDEFAAFLGVGHCLGVASGTDALELALLGVGCEAGDEVVVAANCGGYASAAARKRRAARALRRRRRRSRSASRPRALAAALTPDDEGRRRDAPLRTRRRDRGDRGAVRASAGSRSSRTAPRPPAPAATAAAPARSATRPRSASTRPRTSPRSATAARSRPSSDEIAERVRRLRQYGWGRKYEVTLAGGRNSRLDELQAAVLRVRLGAPRRVERRAARASSAATPRRSRPTPAASSARDGEDYVAHLAVARGRGADARAPPRSTARRSRPTSTTRSPTTASPPGAPTTPTCACRSPSTRASTC